jgi:CRISPR-associated protein Cas1
MSTERITKSHDSQDLLPARMLNEFVYCPRLFFYEHVEGVFVHNADTLRGADQHTRVDSGTGAMPKARKKKTTTNASAGGNPASTDAPSDSGDAAATVPGDASAASQPAADATPKPEIENETIHSRSVMLGSDTLGIVAKLDLVEATIEPVDQITDLTSQIAHPRAATVVRPVEYKSGAPRVADDGSLVLWDADRMQLGLQMLLLRENGYVCDEGVVYYRQTRQRVRFTLDADTEAWIHRNIAAARSCIGGPIPAPLAHSAKCPRCSLVSVCLPDETNLLRTGPDAELPSPETQLAFSGLLDGEASADPDTLTDALADDDPAWEALPEPRIPRLTHEGDVRRLIAPDIDTKALYVNTPGVGIMKKGETVVVKEQGAPTLEVRIKDLHHLAIFGSAQLSTALVQTLCEREIPVSFFSMGGWFYGLARGHGLTNVFTRIRQFSRATEPEQALPFARLFAYGKIRNQRTLLMRNHVEPPPSALRILKHAASAALAANSHAMLLGIEGAAALCYFRNFGGMIKTQEERDDIPGLEDPAATPTNETSGNPPAQALFNFDFKTRNRRPPRDPVNALLSLAYSLLARDCTIAAHAVGFDPYIGFFHQPRFGRPALALDIMEEFRPLVADSVVLTAINNRMLGPGDFVQAGDAVNLSYAGRRRFLFAYEKRMGDTVTHPVFDYKVSYRRAIELQFRLLARALTGEIDRYVPFTTR